MSGGRGETGVPSSAGSGSGSEAPSYRSHLVPRTRDGWIAVLLFLGLLALAEPPLVYALANRVEPRILGLPFLYVYLLAIYVALIGVLLWTLRRRV